LNKVRQKKGAEPYEKKKIKENEQRKI